MKRIGLINTNIKEKTLIFNDLIIALKKLNYNVNILQNYSVEYIQKYGQPKNLQTHSLILQKQLEKEKEFNQTFDFCLIEAPILLDLAFGFNLGNLADPQDCFCYVHMIELLLQLNLSSHYDYLFYFPQQFSNFSDEFKINQRVRGFLDLFNLNYYTILTDKTKNTETYVQEILSILSEKQASRNLTHLEILEKNTYEILKTKQTGEVSFPTELIMNNISQDFFPLEEEQIPTKNSGLSLLKTPSKNQPRLRDLILSGKTASFKLEEQQFIVKNFSNKPGRTQYRHIFRNCLSLMNRKFDLEDIKKEDIPKYPLCFHCARKLKTLNSSR